MIWKNLKKINLVKAAANITGVWIVLAIFILLASLLSNDWKGMALNNFGDYLAGVFAPLAFLWLGVAVFLQKDELAAQREELRLTRKELGLQREVMKEQAKEYRASRKQLERQTITMEEERRAQSEQQNDELFDAILSDLRKNTLSFHKSLLTLPQTFGIFKILFKNSDKDSAEELLLNLYTLHQLYLEIDPSNISLLKREFNTREHHLKLLEHKLDRLKGLHPLCSLPKKTEIGSISVLWAFESLFQIREIIQSDDAD